MRRAGTEQRVLLPDEIRDINNRRIDIVPTVVTSPIIDKRSEYKPYVEPAPSPKAEVKERKHHLKKTTFHRSQHKGSECGASKE